MGWFLVCNSCGHKGSVGSRDIVRCPECDSDVIKVQWYMGVPKSGDVKGIQSKLPARGMRARTLLYGIIILIAGISWASIFPRYTRCSSLDFSCTPRLRYPSELIGDYAFSAFLIILGTLMIIGWLLSRSSFVQDSVRDWRQRQRRPREKRYNLENED